MSVTSDPAPPPASGAGGTRKRRMTARWQYTNRLNARASTGPKTAAGKARVAGNARRHGLSVPVSREADFGTEVARWAGIIAQSVNGQPLDEERHLLACLIADTLVDLRRIRLTKRPLRAAVEADPCNCAQPAAQLWRLDRYERRALARRERALRQFNEAVMPLRIAQAIRQNKAMREKAKKSNEAAAPIASSAGEPHRTPRGDETAEQSHARKSE